MQSEAEEQDGPRFGQCQRSTEKAGQSIQAGILFPREAGEEQKQKHDFPQHTHGSTKDS